MAVLTRWGASQLDLGVVTGSRLAFVQALVSFDGYRGGDAWRRAFTWHGRHNRYEPGGAWLRLEGRAGPAWDERAFERLWAGRP